MPAGRRAVVGHAAALRQPGRLHGSGALLLFSGRAQGLRRAQCRGAGRAGRLRRRLYLHRRGPCHARAAPQMASAHRAADSRLRPCGIRAHRRIAGGRAAGPGCDALGGEGRRSQVLPVVLVAAAGALALVFACYGFSPDAFSYLFRSAAGFLWVSLDPARRFFSPSAMPASPWPPPRRWSLSGASASRATLATPLRCFAHWLLAPGDDRRLGTPWLWALPFLLTFIGGVFADAYEGPRGRLALGGGGGDCAAAGGVLRAEFAGVAVDMSGLAR